MKMEYKTQTHFSSHVLVNYATFSETEPATLFQTENGSPHYDTGVGYLWKSADAIAADVFVKSETHNGEDTDIRV